MTDFELIRMILKELVGFNIASHKTKKVTSPWYMPISMVAWTAAPVRDNPFCPWTVLERVFWDGLLYGLLGTGVIQSQPIV